MITDPRALRSGLILFAWLCLLAGLTLPAIAQEKSPFPEYTGDRVYVKDVPGSYQSLTQAIKEIERVSPQTYFAVVVPSVGSGPDAATAYVDELYNTWIKQAEAKGLKLDPERSVIVLVATGSRRVAVHVGSLLKDRFGLVKETAQRTHQPSLRPTGEAGQLPRGHRVDPGGHPQRDCSDRHGDRRGQNRYIAVPRTATGGRTEIPGATGRERPQTRSEDSGSR